MNFLIFPALGRTWPKHRPKTNLKNPKNNNLHKLRPRHAQRKTQEHGIKSEQKISVQFLFGFLRQVWERNPNLKKQPRWEIQSNGISWEIQARTEHFSSELKCSVLVAAEKHNVPVGLEMGGSTVFFDGWPDGGLVSASFGRSGSADAAAIDVGSTLCEKRLRFGIMLRLF